MAEPDSSVHIETRRDGPVAVSTRRSRSLQNKRLDRAQHHLREARKALYPAYRDEEGLSEKTRLRTMLDDVNHALSQVQAP